jgi:hypothetical protein
MVIRLSRLGGAAALRIHDARHCDEIDPGLRHFGYALGFEMFNIWRLRRPSAGIQTIQLARFGVPVVLWRVVRDPGRTRSLIKYT